MGIKAAWNTFWSQANDYVAESKVGEYFDLKKRKAKFSTEIRAGTVTFLTTAYILAVNAQILSDTGGPCSYQDCTGLPDEIGPDCVFPNEYGITNPGYQHCIATVRKSLVTATAASSMVGSILMGLGANLPLATAPGMGLNAYFAYNVVGYRGTGNVAYETALSAVFLEGVIFVILAVFQIRARLIKLIPRSIMLATSGGIGLYLAAIGLESAEGLGIISFDRSTLTTLGGCPLHKQIPTYVIQPDAQTWKQHPNGTIIRDLPQPSSVYACDSHVMESGTVWLGLAGLLVMAVLMSRSFKGSIITGIIFVTVIAWIPGHAASYLGSASPIPGGELRLEAFKRVVALPSLKQTGAKMKWNGFGKGEVWVALLTFLYIDFLDTTGTLLSMTHFINNYVPGFLNEKREFPRQTIAYCVDGVATMAGALMGTSPVAVFIESAAGIREGGRTGITALVVAFYFFIALFFEPILASVPPYAIGPALITVGALMMINVVKIRWEAAAEALPAFLTIVIMPLTYSIAHGVIAGLVGYILINLINLLIDKFTEFCNWRWEGNEPGLPQVAVNPDSLNIIRSITRRRPDSPSNGPRNGGTLWSLNPFQALADFFSMRNRGSLVTSPVGSVANTPEGPSRSNSLPGTPIDDMREVQSVDRFDRSSGENEVGTENIAARALQNGAVAAPPDDLTRDSPFIFPSYMPSTQPTEQAKLQRGLPRVSGSSYASSSSEILPLGEPSPFAVIARNTPVTLPSAVGSPASPSGRGAFGGGAAAPPAYVGPHGPLGNPAGGGAALAPTHGAGLPVPPPRTATPTPAHPLLGPSPPAQNSSGVSRRRSIVDLIQDWDSIAKELVDRPNSTSATSGRGSQTAVSDFALPERSKSGNEGRVVPIPGLARASRRIARDSIERSISLPGLPVLAGRGGLGAGLGSSEPDVEQGGRGGRGPGRGNSGS